MGVTKMSCNNTNWGCVCGATKINLYASKMTYGLVALKIVYGSLCPK